MSVYDWLGASRPTDPTDRTAQPPTQAENALESQRGASDAPAPPREFRAIDPRSFFVRYHCGRTHGLQEAHLCACSAAPSLHRHEIYVDAPDCPYCR